jgi:general secretion pathway protein I
MKRAHGLTLIEVLIALAIISIAMTAIIKATGDHIRSTVYLKRKTTAYWVAQQVLTEVCLGVIKVPDNGELSETSDMLGKSWYWHVNKEDTGNGNIEKVTVTVSDTTLDDNANGIVSLVSYVS